jgi:hypothetical protein
VIFFDPNVHILTVFALHYCEPLLVTFGHSVCQLFTIVLCYFIFELIEFRPYHVSSVIVDDQSALHMGITGDEILEFLVYVVAPAVSLESLGACFLVQSLLFVLL